MKRKLVPGLAVGLGATAIALLLWTSGALERWEYATWAWRVHVFARPGPATDRIKLILLDQNSLDWGAKENHLSWPWPREVYGPIIDFCKRSGARALVFDVLYTEPSVYGSGDDLALQGAIERGPPFVATLFLSGQSGSATAWPDQLPKNTRLELTGLPESLRPECSLAMPRATFPILEVAAHSRWLACTADEPDMDGVFRRIYPFRLFNGEPVPSLALAGWIAGGGLEPAGSAPPSVCSLNWVPGQLCAGGKRIPIDRDGRMLLRYRGPSGTFASYSAAAVIQSELLLEAGQTPTIADPNVFKDCYVLFGFSAPGLLDLRPTPISKVSPGVEIYATALDNMLSGDALRDPSGGAVAGSTAVLALCSALLIVLFCQKAWHSALAFTLLLPLPGVIGFAAYPLGFWWPITVQAIALALALVGAVLVNYATEGRQKAFIKNAFRHYLSPLVIERILADPSHLKLGGERRELTIFFSDLQGFSSFSERLEPEVLTGLLNDYLSDMTEIILEEGGTLDKYEGDAIIAFWNAPLAQPDHAERACRAARRCQLKLEEKRGEYQRRTGAVLRMRIGMNTGEVVVGNMGSRKRFDYTVLGDAANLASRLEGANKAFGTFTMVSEETWSKLPEGFIGRELGALRVVGRKTPVRVFEPTGLPGESKNPQLVEFERGLSLCRARDWRKALELFESLPDDPAAQVYAERCRTLLEDPAGEWDGVWNLTAK